MSVAVTIRWSEILGVFTYRPIGGHLKAENWGCPDTVDGLWSLSVVYQTCRCSGVVRHFRDGARNLRNCIEAARRFLPSLGNAMGRWAANFLLKILRVFLTVPSFYS